MPRLGLKALPCWNLAQHCKLNNFSWCLWPWGHQGNGKKISIEICSQFARKCTSQYHVENNRMKNKFYSNHKGDIYYCAENISTFNYTTNQGFEHCALCNKSSRNHYNIQHFKCPSITCNSDFTPRKGIQMVSFLFFSQPTSYGELTQKFSSNISSKTQLPYFFHSWPYNLSIFVLVKLLV